MFLVECGRRKAVEHAPEAMEGEVELPEDDGVAQADGLPKQLLIEIDDHQSAGQRVFGIEQPDVGLVVAYVEILAQHAVVEQQLHVVVFLLIRPVLVGKVALDVEVLARFLLHEQLHVGRHEVDAALQAQLLAHEGRFQEDLTAVVGERRARFEHRRTELAEEFGHDLPDVLGLRECRRLELLVPIEVFAGAELQRLLLEVLLEGLFPFITVFSVDDVVERLAGKVTHQDGLAVGRRGHAVDGIGQRMVAIVGEAAGDTADIDQEIRLHDDELGRGPCPTGLRQRGCRHVNQVELHAGPQHINKV